MVTTKVRLTPEVLKLKDPAGICHTIETFIRDMTKKLGRDGAALGLSGGVDSALVAYLLVRILGANKVFSLYMPEKESNPKHGEDARMIAETLGIEFKVVSLTPILEARGVYNIFPVKYFKYIPSRKLKGLAMRFGLALGEKITGKDLVIEGWKGSSMSLVAGSHAYTNAKHRQRMVVLYDYADRRNLLVAGGANRAEYMVGVFVKYGIDGAADIMPVLPFYKNQIRQLARYVGVPKEIAEKPGDPDLMAGLESKDRIFGTEDTVDLVVFGLENGLSTQEIASQLNCDLSKVERLRVLIESSEHMRRLAYSPNIPGLVI
jgi:NAD+ synthase